MQFIVKTRGISSPSQFFSPYVEKPDFAPHEYEVEQRAYNEVTAEEKEIRERTAYAKRQEEK